MAYVARVVKQRSNDSHLRPRGTKPIARIYAALIPRDEARERQRHVERMLHVVVSGVTSLVAGIASREQPLAVIEGKP